jgi:D-serine deaminase-like pyridoxal phosphate-dependent protein
LVDRSILERNLAAMQTWADSREVTLRPHAKTHKSPAIGRRQIELGAAGLTVATLAEAEAMDAAGLGDLFVAYPPVGPWRLARLGNLMERAKVTVAAGSVDDVVSLSGLGARLGREVGFRWEVDSGLGRLGTGPGDPTVAAVSRATEQSWTRFEGLFTHAGHAYRAASTEEMDAIGRREGEAVVETAERLRDGGIPVEVVSVGSTPTARSAARVSGVTEIRPGTYVFHDATQVTLGVAELGDCAQTVLATVVGRPASDRVVVDAGSKALPAENPSGRAAGFGLVVGRPDHSVERLFEEHAVIRALSGSDLRIGQRIRIIPNHACTTTSLHARINMVEHDHLRQVLPIEGRDWRGIPNRERR